MRRLIVVIIAIIAQMHPVEAQNVSVNGTVRDAKTGEAIPFVNVGLMRQTDTVFVRGTATNFEGNFRISDIKPGSYMIQASCVGYHNWIERIDIKEPIHHLEINLKGGTTLQEVQITAERPLYVMDGEKNMYNTKEDPSIQTGTASDALQNAPGVEVDAEGNITLRGVSNVEIWINDRPSHMNEEALKQYIKQLPANTIERIEVITNPSARYSTNGGVINIVTNQKVTRNELLCIGLQTTTTPMVCPWISYVWANEKVDFNLYVNGRYGSHESGSDGTNTLFNANGDTSRSQRFKEERKNPNLGSYMGFNMNWNIDSLTHLSAWMGAYPGWSQGKSNSEYTYREYLPALTDLSYSDSAKSRTFWGGGYAGAWFEHRYDTTGRKLSLNFNGNLWSNSSREDQWRRYHIAMARNYDRRATTDYFGPSASLGINYTLPLKNGFEMETGAEVGFSYNTNDQGLDSLLTTGDYDNIRHRTFYAQGLGISTAAYITAQKRWEGFTAKLGLRIEDDIMSGSVKHPSLNDKQSIDTSFIGLVPSIHLSYQTKNFENYSLSYTLRFSQSEDLVNYLPFRQYSDYSFITGNPNLKMSYTHNLEAAFNKYVMGFGNIGLNAYLRANTNEIGTTVRSDYDTYLGIYLVNYSQPVNIGSSHTEGVEANITYRPTGFLKVRLNASLFNYGFPVSRISEYNMANCQCS